jgi:trehalose synthase
MAMVSEVAIAPLPPDRYGGVLAAGRAVAFQQDVARARVTFQGRTIWNINSTASGGGVAEMLRSLLAYAQGAGVDARWLVISGTPEFFTVTKRLHNQLHNFAGDGGDLGPWEREQYDAALKGNAEELHAMVKPRDLVLLHDPQTAGLVPGLKALGVTVIWRCHVGIDNPGPLARRAWEFLIDYVRPADAYVFSRRSFAWEGLDAAKTVLIAPSIDAFSPKNLEMDAASVRSILVGAGLVQGSADGEARFHRQDGSTAPLRHRATLFQTQPATLVQRVVLQVSRWDQLKDPLGVIRGFAEFVAPNSDAHLIYAGPAVESVSDDPEGKAVLDEAIRTWSGMPDQQRSRIHLATLPMDDGEENAAMVNALQRHAYAVIQKSTAEGFGLTVAEAMWKARPVVASRIGGIQDQIEDGRTGILLDDPADLEAYGRSVLALLQDEHRAAAIGEAARERVRDDFLGARSLMQHMEMMEGLIRN